MWLSKTKRTKEERKKFFSILGGSAQVALVLAIVLGRLEVPNLDFIIGMLYGFSMVGNLAFIVSVSRHHFRGRHD
jgi:hypothetical protein